MANFVTPLVTTTPAYSINNLRRTYNFGNYVANLAPQQSPFFTYLSKVAKQSTNDPVFQFMERRHQWQRRNFEISTDVVSAELALGATQVFVVKCFYDNAGKDTGTTANECPFLLVGQTLDIKDDAGNHQRFRITVVTSHDTTSSTITAKLLSPTFTSGFNVGNKGQVIGSAFAEATTVPTSWNDVMSSAYGYTQIFKTAIPIHSGSSMATEYRGISNEKQRQWTEKLMEHKIDIEHTMLYGYGYIESAAAEGEIRHSWGIEAYTRLNGKQYGLSYDGNGYDDWLALLEDFFAPESGNSGQKLCLCSRKVLGWLNRLGDGAVTVGGGLPAGSFLSNTSANTRIDITRIPGKFGHELMKVWTIFGTVYFVEEPLLREGYEDTMIMVDLKNVKYRPLVGNGISRDTFIMENVQSPGLDGRQDGILTEAGLKIELAETHAVVDFS